MSGSPFRNDPLLIKGQTAAGAKVPVAVDADGKLYVVLPADALKGLLGTIEIEHYMIHASKHFYVQENVNVTGAGTSYDILIVTPDSYVLPHLDYEIASDTDFDIQFFEDVTVTANGTALAVHNNNRNSAVATASALYSGPTWSGGTDIAPVRCGQGKTVGKIARDHEIILLRNKKYVLRASKVSSGTGNLNVTLDWYEG